MLKSQLILKKLELLGMWYILDITYSHPEKYP